MNFINSLGC